MDEKAALQPIFSSAHGLDEIRARVEPRPADRFDARRNSRRTHRLEARIDPAHIAFRNETYARATFKPRGRMSQDAAGKQEKKAS
jgi:hypothetical protein